jgi:hypothetical protein
MNSYFELSLIMALGFVLYKIVIINEKLQLLQQHIKELEDNE